MSNASGSDAVAQLDATENIGGNASTGFYRVFHIPDWLVSFSGYTFDGPTFIPVDFAAPDAPTNHVDNTIVLINGQPTDYAQFIPYNINGTTYWGMGIYFDRLPNGTNTIQLITTVRQSDELSDQTPYMVFSNAPQTIVIGNSIMFTNWDDLIWNNSSYTFRAHTVTNVDWEIDIYDYNGDFVNYQTGHSSDGNIAWTWNLYDYWGNPRSNPDADPVFYSTTTLTGNLGSYASGGASPDTSTVTLNNPPAAASYPSIGGWVISYMDNFYKDGRTNFTADQPYFSDGVGSIVGAAYDWQIPVYPIPVKFGRAYTQADRDDSWTTLMGYLQSGGYRNFYYFGHGNPNGIGGDINILDNSNNIASSKVLPGSYAYIADWYVRQNITANPSSGSRPYRFVFLDACATGNGDLPDAFGIPKQHLTLGYYTSTSTNPRHIRPSAFVGWNTEVGSNIKGWGDIPYFWNYRKTWAAQWSLGNGGNENLKQALNDARDFNPQWASASKIDGALCVYGYWDLLYRQYNHEGDWP